MAYVSYRITHFYLPTTREPKPPLLSSRKASPPFDWYSLRLLTEGWPGWVEQGEWLYTEMGFLHQVLNSRWVCTFIPTSLPDGTGKRRLRMDMLWCHGAQNIGLSNHKLKSALTCTVWSQCTPVPDGEPDEHHGNSATIRPNERMAR